MGLLLGALFKGLLVWTFSRPYLAGGGQMLLNMDQSIVSMQLLAIIITVLFWKPWAYQVSLKRHARINDKTRTAW